MTEYSAQEVADRLGISIFTVHRHIHAGRLVASQRDGSWEIRRQDLDAFLQQREIPVFPTTRTAIPAARMDADTPGTSPDLSPSSART